MIILKYSNLASPYKSHPKRLLYHTIGGTILHKQGCWKNRLFFQLFIERSLSINLFRVKFKNNVTANPKNTIFKHMSKNYFLVLHNKLHL
jgi:hypothetical protein